MAEKSVSSSDSKTSILQTHLRDFYEKT